MGHSAFDQRYFLGWVSVGAPRITMKAVHLSFIH